MAITIEYGSIDGAEPVVTFKADDMHLPEILAIYAHLCKVNGGLPNDVMDIMSIREVIVNRQETPKEVTGNGSVLRNPRER